MILIREMTSSEISIYVLYPVPESMPIDYIAPKDTPHYIGSSKNCAARLQKHLWDYKYRESRKPDCSSSTAINGANFMCLEVLEKCEENERYIREEHWLNHYKNEGYFIVNKNNPNRPQRTRDEYNLYMKMYMRNYRNKK